MSYRTGAVVAVCVVSSGCGALLGLDQFTEGGAGGATSTSSETSTGVSTSSGGSTSTVSSATSSTTGSSGTGGGCAVGETECGGACAVIATDHINCGKCGNVCDQQKPTNAACVGSMCQPCAPGTADCDGLGVNACEADLEADKKNCGACGHTCAGSCSGGHCQPVVLLAAQPFANSMILQGSTLYVGTNANKLVAIATDGSGVKDLASDQSQFAPLALDVDHGYWVDDVGGTLHLARTLLVGGGGAVEDLVALPAGISPNGLAVDATGVYFTDGTADKVEKYDFATSKLTDIATMQPFASQVLIVGSDLFWATSGSTTLTKKALPGGNPTVLCLNSGVNQLIGSSTDLFFNGVGGISTMPINGGNPANCPVALTNKSGTALATDGVAVFWTDNVDATIKSVPVGGGGVTTLGSTLGTAIGLAVDDKFVYWQIKTGLNIMKLEKNP